MGEVYLAEDTRLKRQVAIKILPKTLASHLDRRERFEREAQAIAALNDSHIVTIYSVEQAGDALFMTMEFVQGQTVAELIGKTGLPLKRLLSIATQIVDAVIVAHERNIVHRDLKPSNVMVGAGDRVKVLDFGLAKLREGADGALAESLATRELTGEGTIVGTVAYMSPEQAEGKAVDGRSDIFSLGVIFYELATGERPFKGDTSLSVLSAILKDTPRTLSDVNPTMPRDLARIVRHCLVKDPERRYQSAKDVRNDLEELQQTIDSGEFSTASHQQPRSTWWPVAAAALGTLSLFALVTGLWLKTSAGSSTAPPAAIHTRLTQMEGVERYPSLSPDGKWVVYAASGDIYLQSVTGQTPINLTKDSPSTELTPSFAPDGESIAFRSDREGGGIFVMGRTGEAVRRVTTKGFMPAWLPDGRQLLFSTEGLTYPMNRSTLSELWIVDTQGGQPRSLFRGDAVQPRVSPHGKRIAFWAVPADVAAKTIGGASGSNRDIWTIDLNGEYPVRATTDDATDWNPVWSPDGGWLYFLSDRGGSMNLWRVAIDEPSGVTAGKPQPVTAPASYVADFSLSADGTVGTYSSILFTGNIGRVDFDAKTATATGPVMAVTSGTNRFTAIDPTKDGRSIVASTLVDQEDLYVVTLPGGALRRVTNDRARDGGPRWSPDGRHIFFHSDRSGPTELWRIDADGGGLKQLTTTGSVEYAVPSQDGARVLATDTTGLRLFIFDIRDFSKPVETLPPLIDSTVSYLVPDTWSPDGRQISISGYGGRASVWVYSLESRTYRRLADGTETSWLADSRRLVYSDRDRLWVVDTNSGDTKEVLSIPGERLAYPMPIARDSELLFTRIVLSSDVWTVRFTTGK